PASYTHNSMTIPFTNRGATLILEDVDQSITKKPTIIDKSVDDAKAASQAVINAARVAASSSRDTWVVPRTRQAIDAADAQHCPEDSLNTVSCKAAESTADALKQMIDYVIQTTPAVLAAINAVEKSIKNGVDPIGFIDGSRYVAYIPPPHPHPDSSIEGGIKKLSVEECESVIRTEKMRDGRLVSAQTRRFCARRKETRKVVLDSKKAVNEPDIDFTGTKYCLLTVPDTSSDYNTFFSLGLKTLSFQGYDLCASKKNAGIRIFFGNFMTDEPIPAEHNSLMYGTNRTFKSAHTKFCQ
ncbi:MAG: hypothetical protein OXC44_06995, partial [Proteobacteria bacterium]|nr:hypothetical protein [Pseudomonadota bacterium]